jgi:hypothetical protein
VSKHRHVHRFPYLGNPFTEVTITTADGVRLEVHLGFRLGREAFEIDITKKEVVFATKLCRALMDVADQQHRAALDLARVDSALQAAVAASRAVPSSEAAAEGDAKATEASAGALAAQVTATADALLQWLQRQQLPRQTDVKVGATLRQYLAPS